ncbi:MAG: glycosyltransferase [Gemmatimonadaceae bacterium]|nr:glycosyltransferase [Gemmatimonadaceae bacterium]
MIAAALLFALSIVAIGAIWLGYPALMLLWAGVRSRANVPHLPPFRAAWPRVTAVLATRESPAVVRARVANLLDTEWPADALDVIVTIDAEAAACAPADLEGTFVRADGSAADNVRVIVGDGPGGKACALNAAVRIARGDLLLMADSRQRFERDTLPKLAAALGDARFGAASGALTLGGDGRSPVHRYWALEKRLRHAESLVHSSVGVTGAVYALRRALWPTLPAGTILDDVYVPMALVLAGHRIAFVPDAIATDVRDFDASAEQGRKARTLTGVLQLCRLLPDVLSPARNPIWGRFIAHKLLRLTTPLWAVLGAVSGAWLVAALLLEYPRPTLLALGVAALVLVLVPPLRRLTLGVLRWGLAMQVATVKGVLNGARGRWAVWTSR